MIESDSKSGARQNSPEVLNSVGALPNSHRVQIADLVFQQQHVMAQEIYEQFNAQSRFVLRATDYNTLKLLVDNGFPRQVTVDASQGLYDSDVAPHYHFFDSCPCEIKDIGAEQFEILGMPEPPPSKSGAAWMLWFG